MGLNDVTIQYGQGGLGRALPGEDYISGMMFYTNTLPSGFSTSARIKQVLSVAQAEALGIVDTYSDATAATFTHLITTKGNTGDTIKAVYTGISGDVDLGLYTVASAASTIALQGAAWAAVINAGTYLHGCTASFTTATLTVTLPKSQGVFPNSGTPIVVTKTGAFAGTLTQPSGGVASLLAQWHYHIKEYFRIAPQGNLYVQFNVLSANTFDYAELLTLQNFANNKIRQVGIYLANTGSHTTAANIATACDAVQTQCTVLTNLHAPLSVVIATDISTISDLTTLVDLGTHTDRQVSVTIGQDGANLGYKLYKGQGYSITNVGAILGAVSLSAVNEDIGWVAKFNLTDGVELSVPAYANGNKVNVLADVALMTQLNLYKYILLRYWTGVAGTYVIDNPCAIASSSDYAYINDNRTIDKAARLLYAGYLPALNSNILLNADGTLSDTAVAYFTSLGNTALDPMVRDTEISNRAITIDPAQNVLSTSTLYVTAQVQPTGVARFITVKLGYVLSI
jgi:Protein of unknown function (DUF2586)